MKNIQFRPLGDLLEIVQSIGFDISYAYDDLLFSEHNAFLIRFDSDKKDRIWLHFNQDLEKHAQESISVNLKNACHRRYELLPGALFSIRQVEGKEELELNFL